ncbi:hypothetical protein DET57_13056 [Klebsiella oxytoca]|uniref:Uncharacterized protein n=1 Tax=Klebsiella oxytoca TaxID=571 RepID=A0A318FE79_KLEOX|nr:hypothetical protein DET57_13056 [Klebsiella oxytoca]
MFFANSSRIYHVSGHLLRRREIDNQRPGRHGNILRCESGRPRQPDDHHRQNALITVLIMFIPSISKRQVLNVILA